MSGNREQPADWWMIRLLCVADTGLKHEFPVIKQALSNMNTIEIDFYRHD